MSSPRRSATPDEAVSTIRRQHPDFDRSYRAARKCIDEWIRLGWLPPDRIEGREILDWECGLGAFAARFLELGAARIVGIDSWLDPAYVDSLLSMIPNAHFERISLEDYAARGSEKFDLVFANTVSEHLPNLSARLRDCGDVLAPGGELFVNHDNYFQPVGSHDHGFLYYEGDSIVFQGVECWKLPEKCAASEVFLKEMRTRLPWTWDDGHDALRDPDACEQCPYYRRAQPWAHLIYQDDFRRLYPNVAFSSGYDESTLNKVSTFQLRQMLVESGFDIVHWYPSMVYNRPPRLLLDPPFNLNEIELRTSTVIAICKKAPSNPYRPPHDRSGDAVVAPKPGGPSSHADRDMVRDMAGRELDGKMLLRLALSKLKRKVFRGWR